jgi:hypothetical protein
MNGYVAPEYRSKAYACPFCGVMAAQHFFDYERHDVLTMSQCQNCRETMVWYRKQIIWPLTGNAPVPNPDMPEEIKVDYLEARSIATVSPRGAAALLRLAIDKLTTTLGAEGRTLDDRIQALVNNGLDPLVQQMLDSVRVVGNDTVHPGQIDVRDDPEIHQALFWLVNEIVDERITKPRRVQQIYGTLPEGKRKAIEERDRRSRKSA